MPFSHYLNHSIMNPFLRALLLFTLSVALQLFSGCDRDSQVLGVDTSQLASSLVATKTGRPYYNPADRIDLKVGATYTREQISEYLRSEGYRTGENFDLSRATASHRVGDLVVLTTDPGYYQLGSSRVGILLDVDANLFFDLRTRRIEQGFEFSYSNRPVYRYRYHQNGTIGLPLRIGDFPDTSGEILMLEVGTWPGRYGGTTAIATASKISFSVNHLGARINRVSYKWQDAGRETLTNQQPLYNGSGQYATVSRIYYTGTGREFGRTTRTDYPDEVRWQILLSY